MSSDADTLLKLAEFFAYDEFPQDYVSTRAEVLSRYPGLHKTSSHLAELAGLGILAKPSYDELKGRHVDEKKKAKWELAGLGTLAAPSAHGLAKKHSNTYSQFSGRIGNAVSGFGRKLLRRPG